MNVPETFFSVHEELVLFALSCIAGAVIGICYDVLRALRLAFPHGIWLTAAEDAVFLGAYAVFLSAFASAAARGELRFYYIIGNAAGFSLYFFTLGSIVMRTLRKLTTAAGTVFKWITAPFRRVNVLICRKARAKFVGSSKSLVKFIKKMKMHLHCKLHLLYNKTENKKRKNVNIVAKKNKNKNKEKRSVQ